MRKLYLPFILLFVFTSVGFGQLYISEISEGTETTTEFLEIYNNGLSEVDLTGYKLVRADPIPYVFDLGVDGELGDLSIPAGGIWVITRGADRSTFEAAFSSFPLSSKFYDGNSLLYFGAADARRWLLRANDGTANTDDGTLVDDTQGNVGGSDNRSIQNPVGIFITSSSSSGINSTPGILDDGQVLPVELTSFTATAMTKGVMLNWSTATEVNNYGFDIERTSTSLGTDWKKIGFVEGHGNSNSPKDYTYADNSLVIGEVSYRLKQIDIDGAFEYSDAVTLTSTNLAKYELHQNHPNPFNPSTVISFTLAELAHVNITVYNAIGQKVMELANEQMDAGFHNVNFDGSSLSTGFYFYRLETPNYSKTMKMILLR